MKTRKRIQRILGLFLAACLIVQTIPATAVMVGCAMGPEQAACSKWSDPAGKACCCKGAMQMGRACCKPHPAQKNISFRANPKAGCQCQFLAVAQTVKYQRGAVNSTAQVASTPAILAAPAPTFNQPRPVEPNALGTDSSPPERRPTSNSQARAPPIDAV